MANKPKTPTTQEAQQSQGVQQAPVIQQDNGEHRKQVKPDSKDGIEKTRKRLAALQAALDPTGPNYKPELAEAFQNARSILADSIGDVQQAADFIAELEELEPFIQTELAKDPDGAKLSNFMDTYTARELLDMAEDPDNAFAKALAAARENVNQQSHNLLQVKYKPGVELKASTDKLSNIFYSVTAPAGKELNGQRGLLTMPERDSMNELSYERHGASKEISLFYDFFTNESRLRKIGINNKFDSYDFFISAIADNLFLDGNNAVSLTKFWHELGNTTSPSTAQLTELYKRLVRGATTIVTIDDFDVQKAWGNNKYSEIISPLMPLQIKGERFIANGNVASATIIINNLSPFFVLSQSLGHYSTWKRDILKLYTGRKTPRYYAVFQYLMIQIGWLRNPTSARSNKITYKDLYEYTGDTSTRSKQLTRDMMYRLFDEVFIPAKYIKSYKEDTTGEPGVIINCTKNPLALPKTTKKKKSNSDVV